MKVIDTIFFDAYRNLYRVRTSSDGTIWLYTAVPGIREEWVTARQVTSEKEINQMICCAPPAKYTSDYLYDLPIAEESPVKIDIDTFCAAITQSIDEFRLDWLKNKRKSKAPHYYPDEMTTYDWFDKYLDYKGDNCEEE